MIEEDYQPPETITEEIVGCKGPMNYFWEESPGHYSLSWRNYPDRIQGTYRGRAENPDMGRIVPNRNMGSSTENKHLKESLEKAGKQIVDLLAQVKNLSSKIDEAESIAEHIVHAWDCGCPGCNPSRWKPNG